MNLEFHLPLVLDLCLKSSAILLAAFAIAGIARKTSAARRHLIWLAAFTTLAILPLTVAISPRWSWSLQRPASISSIIVNSIPIAESAPAAAPERKIWKSPSWPTTATAAWLAGALLLLIRQAAGFWKLRTLRQQSSLITSGPAVELAAEFGDAEMRQSPLCTVPLTWGWRRPVVVLPESASSWPKAQLRGALAHEFGHIARRDFLLRQLAQIVRAFYWPNPFVWLAIRALHRTQEQACDDLALQHGASPKGYAMQLLEAARLLSTSLCAPSQAVAMALPSTLEGRVRAIVDEHRDRSSAGLRPSLAAVFAGIVALTGSAFAQVKSAPSEAATDQQILIEMKIIEAPEGALGVMSEGGQPRVRALQGDEFQTEMRKLAQNKDATLLSAPKITALHNQRATIEIGSTEVPSKAAGIKIEVLPLVGRDELQLDLNFKYRRPGRDETAPVPDDATQTTSLKTRVAFRQGMSIFLGGLSAEKGRSIVLVVTASKVKAVATGEPRKSPPSQKDFGKWVPEKPGFVTSPYAPDAGAIDVRGFPPDTQVKDPYTGKIFLVPNPAPENAPDTPANADQLAETPIDIKADTLRTENGISFADGGVVLTHGSAKITGDRLRYDPKKHEVEVTGSARLENDSNVVTCEKIFFWLDTGKVQTEGPSKTVMKTLAR